MKDIPIDPWTGRRFGAMTASLATLLARGERPSNVARPMREWKPTHGNRPLCSRFGQRCAKEGNICRPLYCLNGPFTITVAWTRSGDHGSNLFMPPANATTGASLSIASAGNESSDSCNCSTAHA